MMLLKNTLSKLEMIKQNSFKLEKEIQLLVENNLESLLGLEFVKTEFTIEEYRIDTLAFDKENKSFVVIEYKRGSSYSVIDQGYSYLSTILNNKAEIILEYNEKMNETLKRNEVDWSQTKIIFISQSFTKFQRDSLNFKDLPIELYEIKKYENNLISFEPIKAKKTVESIKTISNANTEIGSVTKEIKKYTLEGHFKNSNRDIVEYFNIYKEKIEEMIPEIEIEPKKLYIAFKLNRKNLVDFKLQKDMFKIWINAKEGVLDDSKKMAKNVAKIGHWGNGDYELTVRNLDGLEYILSLIKDAYNSNK